MLSPIRNITFATPKINQIQKKHQSFTSYNVEKSTYSSNIHFKGYIPYKPTFLETLRDNYFQLPLVNFGDGSLYQLRPDKSQLECAKKLYEGDNLVFCAPTGTGKTAVAHYIITKNLKEGKKTIYTTPLKALANDKLREFKKIYGEDKVGLLTGDIKINTNAPIQIMTTEIYNNQAQNLEKNSRNIGTVVFDEAHYLGDEERGNVWENSIINTPFNKIQILLLSATIGNSSDLTDWVSSLNPSRKTSKVEVNPTERFIPLKYFIHQADYSKDPYSKGAFTPIKEGVVDLSDYNNLSDKQKRGLSVIYKAIENINEYYEMTNEEYEEIFNQIKSSLKKEQFSTQEFKEAIKEIYPEIKSDKIDEATELLTNDNSLKVQKIHVKTHDNNYPALVKDLEREGMLPALIFKLSRNSAANVCQDLKDANIDLTTEAEKEEIEEILEKYKQEGTYLGTNFDKQMLLSGYGYHHAGELPQYRKLIEELFSKKLLKVVAATSTLSAGINMPAKTVVLTGTVYQKYNPQTNEMEDVELTASELHQMAGRAGRRGIDSIGNVVLYNLQTPEYGFKEFKARSVEDMEKRKSRYEEAMEKKPDELQLAYHLIESSSDKLRSFYKPDWQPLSVYYLENTNNDNLIKKIKSSFKYYLSKNPEKEQRSLVNKFENKKGVLIKQGFLEKDKKGNILITPKGKILTMSQGLNPLMLASLLYEEKFKNLSPEALCQMVGYIAGSSEQEEGENFPSFIKERLIQILKNEINSDETIESFEKTRKIFEETENKILRSVKENRIPPNDIVVSESFSGYASFIWAHLNDKDPDTISNFRKITGTSKYALKANETPETSEIIKEYIRKSLEGNVYKIISQGVSILKQIERICDYAISNPNDFANTKYWEELKENTELALILMKQNPIWDETAL